MMSDVGMAAPKLQGFESLMLKDLWPSQIGRASCRERV